MSSWTTFVDSGPYLTAAQLNENFKWVNYGSNLIPVDTNGAGSNNTLTLGSSSYRWSTIYGMVGNLATRLDTPLVQALDGNGLSLKDDGGTLGVFIKDGGNVGIKNANPAEALDVTGNIKASGDIFTTALATWNALFTCSPGMTITLYGGNNKYKKIGNLVFFYLQETLDLSGVAAPYIYITLPSNSLSIGDNSIFMAKLIYSGGSSIIAFAQIDYTNQRLIISQPFSGPDFPNGNGITLMFSGYYEAA